MPKAVYITEAGKRRGWGHYVRSRALADELARQGLEPEFYVQGEVPSCGDGKDCLSMPASGVPEFLEAFSPPPDLTVLDLYEFFPEIFESLRACRLTVCIDDGSDVEFSCSLLVHPNIGGDFTHRLAPWTRYLHGRDAVILRPQFDNLPARKCREEAISLLVALGGTDPVGLSLSIIRLLQKERDLPFQKITVLVGGYSLQETLRREVDDDDRFCILRGIEDIRPLLQKADAGIVAAGTLLYEAVVTGLPSLVLALNQLQAREARTFADLGAVGYLGREEEACEGRWMEKLRALGSWAARQSLAEKSQAIIDGQGRKRVAASILELTGLQETRPRIGISGTGCAG